MPEWRKLGVVMRAFLLVNALGILTALVPMRDWESWADGIGAMICAPNCHWC